MTIPTFVREITSLDERHYRCLTCDRKYVARYGDPDLAGSTCQQPDCAGLIGIAETEGIRPVTGGEGALYPADALRAAYEHGKRDGEAADANQRVAELEAQLKAANERADGNREWVDRAATQAAEELAKQREAYEAQLAQAKRAWEVADDERVTARTQLKEVHGRMEKAEAENVRLRTSLRELLWHNPLQDDLDIYLHALAQWGMGKIDDRPDAADYGLNLLIPSNIHLEDTRQAALQSGEAKEGESK